MVETQVDYFGLVEDLECFFVDLAAYTEDCSVDDCGCSRCDQGVWIEEVAGIVVGIVFVRSSGVVGVDLLQFDAGDGTDLKG